MKKIFAISIAAAVLLSAASNVFAAETSQEYDFENYETLITTDVLDWDLEFTLLPSGYNLAESEHPMTSFYIPYTTDVYEDGITYEKYVRVYLPYGYDENDKDTKYNILYFQHGHGATFNVFDGFIAPENEVSAYPTNLLNNMFDPDHSVMEPFIIVCTSYYMDLTPESERVSGSEAERPAGDSPVYGLPANYYREVVEDMIPAVESQLNVYCEDFSEEGIKNSREHRAWAGYSRGSTCTWYMIHHNMEYFKYFLPTSWDCYPDGFGTKYESDEAKHEAAYQYIKEAFDAHPDLDVFIFASSGGSMDARKMRAQMKYFLDQPENPFSYGLDPELNNFYYTCADGFTHSDAYFPYYLYNAKDVLWK